MDDIFYVEKKEEFYKEKLLYIEKQINVSFKI